MSKRILEDRNCLGCQKVFRPRDSTTRYCSLACVPPLPLGRKPDPWRPFTMDDLDRRSEFVTECGCQIWTGTTGSDYGLIKRKGKSYLAHRISWSITNGPIPEGLCVMHLCDTPTCINPRHLRLGTQAENMADRDRKGRGNPNGSRRKSGQILPGSRARIVTKKTSEGHIK